jgi:hypothetical protein
MSRTKSALAGAACVFLFGGLSFATSSNTSTSCLAEFPGVDVSLSNPTNCATSGMGAFTYSLSASASTSASGGSTSLIAANVSALDAHSYPGSLPPFAIFNVSAQSEVIAQYTTSGALRAGTISIVADGGVASNPWDAGYGGGQITIIQGSQTYSASGVCTYLEGVGKYCPSETFNIELGTSFLVEATAQVNFFDAFGEPYGDDGLSLYEAGAFTLEDSNGAPVATTLVTVPELSPSAAVGLSLALMSLSLLRPGCKRGSPSPVSGG